MKKRVVIVDTSILVVWLRVPGFDEAGPHHLKFPEIDQRIQQEIKQGASLLLTIACIIETGNHIAQIKDTMIRQKMVYLFSDFLENATDGSNGWRIYFSEKNFWNEEELKKLIAQWKARGIYKLSLGDASILKVADSLKPVFEVEVFTGDAQLQTLSQIPVQPVYAPSQKRNQN